ncbi:MAG TPA: hypothetical protein VGB62_05135 [Allosphingosinicella sp.]
MNDACALVREAAKMLKPSYEKRKATEGKAGFEALGYVATYVPARAGLLQGTTDVFLASKPGTNRLFIVITGTESPRDWYENSKFGAYSPVYRDGQFYVPPGHAGFRRGMLNIVRDHVININEYDTPQGPQDCPPKGTRRSAEHSALTIHMCEQGLPRGRGATELVIVGHSRGAGIGMITATAFAGQEIRMTGENKGIVATQAAWPLKLHAIVAFSPPHSVYHRPDSEAGIEVPTGIGTQWDVLGDIGAIGRTIAFIDDRDIVPNLSFGVGRNFGHRFRIVRSGAVLYDGSDWIPDADLAAAHSSRGYCRHILGIADGGDDSLCPPSAKPHGDNPRRAPQPTTD